MGEAEAVGPPVPAAPDGQHIYTPSIAGDRLWLGEILENLPQVRLALPSVEAEADVEVETDPHPLVIVLSQDCDLEQDFKARKEGGSVLPNVLLCDVLPAEELRLKVRDNEGLGKRDWKVIVQNKNERFQFLRMVSPEEDLKGEGLPILAVDFRLYFTIRTEEVYRRLAHDTMRRCRLLTPYGEHLADRFSYYLARVALPLDHAADEE